MAPVFYLIPGLGADARVFQFLQLQGEVCVLEWLPLQSEQETLGHYATRLAMAIPIGQPCWLIGVSFGGLVALEVAKHRRLAQVVLISSLANSIQLPWTLQFARATGCYRLVPPQFLKRLPRLAQWFFGAKSGSEYHLLRQILNDTQPGFARWAIRQLLHWNSENSGPAIRIHGTADRLLPLGRSPVNYPIDGAGHFMIVSHARRISLILNSLATDTFD